VVTSAACRPKEVTTRCEKIDQSTIHLADRIAGSSYRIVGSRGRLRIVHGSSIIIIA
jgi:hypothetical protein